MGFLFELTPRRVSLTSYCREFPGVIHFVFSDFRSFPRSLLVYCCRGEKTARNVDLRTAFACGRRGARSRASPRCARCSTPAWARNARSAINPTANGTPPKRPRVTSQPGCSRAARPRRAEQIGVRVTQRLEDPSRFPGLVDHRDIRVAHLANGAWHSCGSLIDLISATILRLGRVPTSGDPRLPRLRLLRSSDDFFQLALHILAPFRFRGRRRRIGRQLRPIALACRSILFTLLRRLRRPRSEESLVVAHGSTPSDESFTGSRITEDSARASGWHLMMPARV